MEGGSGPVGLGAPKQRLVLALLLARADTVVPVTDIVDELWGEVPPPSAEPNVRLYANNLRRLLAAASRDAPVLARRGRGYLLSVGDAPFDLRQFRACAASGREALQSGDLQAAVAALDEGLGLWRGPAIADLPCGRLLTGWRVAVTEERLCAAEDLAEALLGVGRADRVLAQIGEVVTGSPWRERAHALLIRARYQSGDVAGALAAYDTARRRLIEQLGIEPGEELTMLQKAILNREPALTAPRPTAPRAPAGPASIAPRQLPADVVGFAGRAESLRQQNSVLTGRAGSGVRVSVLTGGAGVGKTAFAVRWAHRAGVQFPDGHLYANLRGFDPLASPVAPADALRGFLEAFEVPSARIPFDLDSRAALFRTLLAERRVLVILDNARDVDQVRPLLPGAQGCLTLITSRDRLAGLVAAEGAQPIVLDLLSPQEAHELLARRLGPERLAAEPDAVADIVAGCGGLPLALTIVAARAATNPEFTLGALAAELQDIRVRLDALSLGEPGTDLRDVLSWSYRRLSAPAARLFRLLGTHAGPEIAAPAAASLAGVPVEEARALLTELARLHLLVEPAPGRYGFHDLIRAYAADLAGSEDPPAVRAAARRRILDYYARTACAATVMLAPRQMSVALPEPEPGATPEAIPDTAAAMAWFTAEEEALSAAAHQAADAGLDRYTFLIAWAVADFGNRRGHWESAIDVQRLAARAAGNLGDRSAQACAHRYLAIAYSSQTRKAEALDEVRRAAALYEDLGDHAGQGRADLLVADLLESFGPSEEALRHAERAVEQFRLADDRAGHARALNSVGWQHALLGQYDQALSYCQRALTLLRELGHRYGEAHAWDSVGYAHHHLGEHPQAIACYRRAIDVFADLGDRAYEAIVQDHLGDAQLEAGDPVGARTTWRHALAVLAELGLPGADEVRAKLRRLETGRDHMSG
jgi:DNA-binding SARP family transcriptional activator/tetratricopeptide (TPR) repeat protein